MKLSKGGYGMHTAANQPLASEKSCEDLGVRENGVTILKEGRTGPVF